MQITTLKQFAEILAAQLAGQPEGAKGKMPSGDLVWIEEGFVVGMFLLDDESNAYQWDESSLDDEALAEINEWCAAPVFVAA